MMKDRLVKNMKNPQTMQNYKCETSDSVDLGEKYIWEKRKVGVCNTVL